MKENVSVASPVFITGIEIVFPSSGVTSTGPPTSSVYGSTSTPGPRTSKYARIELSDRRLPIARTATFDPAPSRQRARHRALRVVRVCGIPRVDAAAAVAEPRRSLQPCCSRPVWAHDVDRSHVLVAAVVLVVVDSPDREPVVARAAVVRVRHRGSGSPRGSSRPCRDRGRRAGTPSPSLSYRGTLTKPSRLTTVGRDPTPVELLPDARPEERRVPGAARRAGDVERPNSEPVQVSHAEGRYDLSRG